MKHLLTFAICISALHATAQSTVDAVLSQIEQNNKTLIAQRQYCEAKKL